MGRVVLILIVVVVIIAFMDWYNRNSDKTAKVIKVPYLPQDKDGITVPPFGVFVHKEALDKNQVIAHEQCHWQQYQSRGLIKFYREYFKGLNDYGYHDHPMEIECRQQTETT